MSQTKNNLLATVKKSAIAAVSLLILPVQALAAPLSGNDLNRIINNTVWYTGPQQACVIVGTGTGDNSVPVGTDNTQTALLFLTQRGLTVEQASGVIGNLMQESGLDPKAVNTSSGAYGIAQWLGGRKTALQDYAATSSDIPTDSSGNRLPVDSLAVQLLFMWHELQTSENGALTALQSESTVEGAAKSWQANYERTTDAQQKRIDYANEVYSNYGGDPSNNAIDCATAGASQFVDNFEVYSQYDPAWKNIVYGDATIGIAGCGPSAMAMIITNLTGTRVTPVETAAYADSQGLYVNGQGSSWNITPVLSAHWNLTATNIANDVNAVNQALANGGLVIMSGAGPVPFTTGGHFIVIRAVTADGMWRIGDSAHPDANNQDWDPQTIMNNARPGNVWAVYKGDS